MSIFEISLIALGLAMDAFAVSLANGVAIKDVKLSHALIFGLYFGGFQFLMALVGWIAGKSFAVYVSYFGNWIAFVVLVFIGTNMIFDTVNNKNNDLKTSRNSEILKWTNMTMLAIATSLDALAVGVSLALIETYIMSSALIIGIFAFVLSIVGVLLGNKLSKLFKKYAEIIGGVILITIGLKILIESFIT